MIEIMEQQIINSINSRWIKDKDKRKEIDMVRVAEAFRTICSSRSSTLSIIDDLKIGKDFNSNIDKLRSNISYVYDWVAGDAIESIYVKYKTELLDKKKEAEYFKEIPDIQLFFNEFKSDIINQTILNLTKFHNI
ncbi:MAG: hypothetical protein ACRC68_10045 [Clostridium sp.]